MRQLVIGFKTTERQMVTGVKIFKRPESDKWLQVLKHFRSTDHRVTNGYRSCRMPQVGAKMVLRWIQEGFKRAHDAPRSPQSIGPEPTTGAIISPRAEALPGTAPREQDGPNHPTPLQEDPTQNTYAQWRLWKGPAQVRELYWAKSK